jgi:lipopolysaccharide transport system permease protein
MSTRELTAPAVRQGEAGSSVTDEIWVVEPRGAGFLQRAREVWRARHLLYYFALRAIQRRYKSTYLGWPWLIIRPLLPAVISTLVFHELAGVDSGETPYFLFFVVGNSTWMLFEDCLTRTTRGLQVHRSLLRKIYFPRVILPASAMAPGLLGFLLYLVLILAVSLYYLLADGRVYLVIGAETLFGAAAVGLTLTFALGLGFFTSVIGAEKRDIRYTLPYALRFWFFLTPIVYPITLVPEQWRWLAAINPMTTIVELFKRALLGSSGQLSLVQLATTLAVIGATFASGLWFFMKNEAASIDRL